MNSKSEAIKCPECKSTHVNKNGRKAGKQNHICVDCGRQFIEGYEAQRGYSEEVKRECLTLSPRSPHYTSIQQRPSSKTDANSRSPNNRRRLKQQNKLQQQPRH